jgi:transcriptional regulator with XRE-family HTH domain
MAMGKRIKQARLALQPNMTQQQLAAAVQVSRPAVTQWETGETRSLAGENLLRVATALRVSPEWLLYGIGSGPGEPVPVPRVEVDADTLRLARAIQSLTADQRALLQALVDSMIPAEGSGAGPLSKTAEIVKAMAMAWPVSSAGGAEHSGRILHRPDGRRS